MEEYTMQNRRRFVKNMVLGSIGVTTLSSFDWGYPGNNKDLIKLTVLHTNDMHSRIDSFPATDAKYPGKGGMTKISTLVDAIRKEEGEILLLDAGDIFQGTPYFNLFGGEPEFKLMSKMGYDAATMGNHDFDNGLEGFHKVLPHANFPFLCSNYNFDDTLLKGATIPHKVFVKKGIKIGVFGIGIELEGLVDPKNYGNTIYNAPIKTANEQANILKNDMECDLVICLSHLGFDYASKKISDKQLAKETNNIDLIIGGHTHTFLDKAETFFNKKGRPVLVNQAGWAALRLGRVDFYFGCKKGEKKVLNGNIIRSKNYAKI